MVKANIPFLARVQPNILIEAQEAPQPQKLLCYQTDGGSGQDHGNKPFQTWEHSFYLVYGSNKQLQNCASNQ